MLHTRNLKMALVLAGSTLVMVVASGCATKSYVRKQVAQLETEVNSENAAMRTDIKHVDSQAERARLMALGNVDYRPVEQLVVEFEFDSAELSPDSRTSLDQVTNTVEAHPNYIIDLLGHADTIGPEAYNEELSRRRANAVLHYLVQNGPGPVARYAIVGLGESLPVTAGGDEDHTASRRVEINVLELVESSSLGSKPAISQVDSPR